MRSDQQLDILRHSDAGLAQAYRQAADTARRDPHYTPDEGERRAAYYLQQAERYEGKA